MPDPFNAASRIEQNTLERMEKTNHSLIAECIQNDYVNDVQNVYAFTISIVENHPQQVNNEIRNALTHLGRAIALNDNLEDAQQEINKARGHFERAKKDCYKLAVIRLHERLNETIQLLEFTEGAIHSKYKIRLKEIIKKRQEAFTEETCNNTDTSSTMYHDVTMELLDLEEQINDQYGSPSTNTAKIRRYFMTALIGHKKRTIYAVCGCLVASFLFTSMTITLKVGMFIVSNISTLM